MSPARPRQGFFQLLIQAAWASAILAVSSPAENITSLRALQQAMQTRQRVVCDLDLTAEVCAVDPAVNAVALRDETGVEVCELALAGHPLFPGERIGIKAVHCALIRRKWSVGITSPPLVDIGGVHSVEEKSGQIFLNAGLQPIRIFYLNAKNPAELELSYSGPGVPPQPVPAGVLFHHATDAPQVTNVLPGLNYFCYDDTPATLDEVRHQPPTSAGLATNFDLRLRVPEEYVAMQFSGLLSVPRAGEYDFTLRSDDGAELYVGNFEPGIDLLGTNPPPATVPPPTEQTQSSANGGEWSVIEGRVTYVGQQSDGLELDLRAGNRSTRLWLADSANVSRPLLLDARVQATGVLRESVGLNGQALLGMMSVVDPANLRVQEIAAEQWDNYPLTAITNLSSVRRGECIVHLQGRVTERQAGQGFILADGPGQIAIQAAVPGDFTNGLAVEVLGNLVHPGAAAAIQPAYCRPVPISPGPLPVLTTAAQVQQLSGNEATRQYPVRLRGVVTGMVDWLGAAVQDSTRGVFFNFDASYHDGLEVGDYVEVNGVTAAGDFAPVIAASSLQVLGRGQMPEPARPNWNQLISGSFDSQYAEVRGIITAVDSNTVTLLTDGGKINVQVHNTGEAALRRLQNTLVRIRGCLLAEWDAQTREVRVGEIKFRNPVIEVEQLPLMDAFAVPTKTIIDLLRFDLNASGFQRVKVSGQIVHVGEGEIFLMQDGKGLRFRPVAPADLQTGDLVDVAGIPDVSGASPVLHEAVVRKTGYAPLPPPLRLSTTDNPPAVRDAILVQAEARLIGLHHTSTDWVLELQTGLRTYQALVSTPDLLTESLPLDSRLRLTGVYSTPNRNLKSTVAAFDLLLNSSRDIQLLERPPWWNLRRLLVAVAVLAAVLAAATLWISQLRRQVDQRTAQLEREHSRRERAEREHALEMERSRIARDLHDDLGSSLTEISVMASTGLRTLPAENPSGSLFQSILQKAHSLVANLEVIVWAVDPEANSLQSLADYLSGYTEDYLTRAGITSRFQIPASLPDVTIEGHARHELFLAVKETLHNIVQHARATEVAFRARLEKGLLEIDIIDNGCGFDPGASVDAGHGLRNIPERLARLGGNAELTSQPGHGTTVSIRLRLPRARQN